MSSWRSASESSRTGRRRTSCCTKTRSAVIAAAPRIGRAHVARAAAARDRALQEAAADQPERERGAEEERRLAARKPLDVANDVADLLALEEVSDLLHSVGRAAGDVAERADALQLVARLADGRRHVADGLDGLVLARVELCVDLFLGLARDVARNVRDCLLGLVDDLAVVLLRGRLVLHARLVHRAIPSVFSVREVHAALCERRTAATHCASRAKRDLGHGRTAEQIARRGRAARHCVTRARVRERPVRRGSEASVNAAALHVERDRCEARARRRRVPLLVRLNDARRSSCCSGASRQARIGADFVPPAADANFALEPTICSRTRRVRRSRR